MSKDVQVRLLDLLDRSYAAAEDPAAFDGFRSAADGFLADAVRTGGVDLADGLDAALGRHAARVERMTHDRALTDPMGAAHAALLMDATLDRVEGNAAAARLLGLTFPARVGDLGFARETLRRLRDIASGLAPATTLRIECDDRLLPGVAARQGDGRVRIALADIDWTPDLLGSVGGVLDLTERETAVLHGLLSGLTQAEIAARTDRSVETIKAQCKAILRKSGCRQMSDVLQLVGALGYLHRAAPARQAETGETLMRAGRRVSWRRYGARAGLPVVLHHAHLRGPFLTGAFAFALARAGLTVYAPSRPGYGLTDPTPHLADYHAEAAADVVALMDHLGHADGITLLGFHGGTVAACHAQHALGRRASGMLLVGGQLPDSQPEEDIATASVSMRIARAALTHTPHLMSIFFRLSMSRYRGDEGARRFYADLLKDCPSDLAALDDPEILGLLRDGGLHAAGLSAQSLIADARANVSDWRALFAGVSCPIHMILGAEDSVTRAPLARRWLARHSNLPLDIVEGAGALMLHTHWPDILPPLRAICAAGQGGGEHA